MSKANEVKCESLSLTPWIFNKTRKKKNQPAHKKIVAPMGKMNKIAKKMTQQSKQEVQQMHRMLQDMDDSMSQNVSDESSSRHI